MTGLNWNLLPIKFMNGLDLKTDPKAVQPGYLLRLENGIFTKGDIIQKRYGVTSLGNYIFNSGTQKLASGSGFANFQDELLIFDGNHVYSRFETNDTLLDRGQLSSVQLENYQVFRTNKDMLRCSSVYDENIEVHVRFDGTNILADVLDSQTKGQIVSSYIVDSTSNGQFRTVVLGNYIYVVVASGSNIILYQLLVQNPSFNRTVIVSDLDSANQLFDIKSFGEITGGAVLAYRKNDGTINVLTLSSFGQISATKNIAESPDTALSVVTDGSTSFGVAWKNNSNGIRMISYNINFQTYFNTTTLDVAVLTGAAGVTNMTGHYVNGQYTVYYTLSSTIAPINDNIRYARVNSVGSSVTSSLFARSVSLATEAWTYNGKGYVGTIFNTPLQATYFAYSEDQRLIAKFAPQNAGGYGVKNFLANVTPIQQSNGSGSFMIGNLNKTQVVSNGNTLSTNRGVQRTQINYGTTNEFSAVQLGQNLHIIGGMLFNYDGKTITEHGFHVYPEGQTLSATISNTGGNISGSIVPGQNNLYTYFFTYRYTDNQGQLHESAESVGQQVSITGGLANTVTWTIPTLRVTNKLSASIGVYRTTANTSTAYMLTSLTGVYNDPNVNTVSFVDTYADSQIISNPFLYTDGGVLSHDPVPAPLALTTNKNRLWMILAENPYALQFSDYSVSNQGVSFNLDNQIILDSFGGPATTLASMDNNLIIFKENSIFYLSGDGPDVLGNSQGSDFTTPLLITADVGCTNPASIVLTAVGLMFQTNKGIYLLNRGLQVQYIGAAVEPYNQYQVSSAVLLADVNEVRFTLLNGPTLVYNYLFNAWGLFTSLYTNLSDAALFNKKYCLLAPNGKIYRETPSTYQDNNVNVPLVIRTAWIKLNPQILQGFQKVKGVQVLGSLGSQHKLFVQVSTNYDDAVVEYFTFDTNTALNTQASWGSGYWGSGSWGSADPTGQGNNAPVNNVYQWSRRLNNTKIQAISFTLSDTFTGSLGAGYSLNELLLEVGQKNGGFKLPGFKNT